MAKVLISRKEMAKWFFSFGLYQPVVEVNLNIVNREREKIFTGDMISGPRGSGKTTSLLNQAKKDPLSKNVIIVANRLRSEYLKRTLKDQGIENVHVYVIDEVTNGRFNPLLRSNSVNLFVDDIEDVMAELMNRKIDLFTTSRKNFEEKVSIRNYD